MEVVRMKKLLILLILLAFASLANAAIIYKWVDDNGVVNFTDDYGQVPSHYRDQVEIKEFVSEGGTPLHTQELTVRPKEETTRDIYGLGETYWRERVRPWKEQLRGATENYERVHRNFMKKAEELSAKRYGSPTQYKTDIIELDRLKEEMMSYENEIAEVKEILERISNEAIEAKADLNWLN
jgi:hypothetical protein